MSANNTKASPVVVCLPLNSLTSKTGKELIAGNPVTDSGSCGIWSPCTVGSSTGLKENNKVRSGQILSHNSITVSAPWQSVIEELEKMYPCPILPQKENNNYSSRKVAEYVKKAWFWPALHYILDHKARYYSGPSEKDENMVKFSTDTLLYQAGDFFAKHVDSRRNENDLGFATVLLFEPVAGLVGGDLVLDIDQSLVYDPNNLLIKENGQVRFSVANLTGPVMLAFQINVPHEVELITAGYRLCHKSRLILPGGSHFFNNKVLTPVISADTIKSIKIQQLQSKIDHLHAEIARLQLAIKNINMVQEEGEEEEDDEYNEVADDIMDAIALAPNKNHMIVLATNLGSKKNDINPLDKMNNEELQLYKDIVDLYPYSALRTVPATRRVFEEDQLRNIYDEENVDKMSANPIPGKITMPDFDGQVHFLGDPEVEVFGYRTSVYSAYNDSTYDYIDDVILLTVICVQLNPGIF